ncbi:MAG: hypothetical protein HY079_03785, partial [Elusimicrobia bacterium]|nr:hypothetical protein [Elusimicrobiota bacterium]
VAALLLPTPASAGSAAPAAPAPAGAPAAGASSNGGMVSLSLVEALAAVRAPQLAGLFSFISSDDAPFAFADYLARDKKALKLYVEKLDDDRKAANGLTAWDHNVCASLVNLYSSPLAATFGRPDEKRLSKINQCVLVPVVPLEDIVARRKR